MCKVYLWQKGEEKTYDKDKAGKLSEVLVITNHLKQDLHAQKNLQQRLDSKELALIP